MLRCFIGYRGSEGSLKKRWIERPNQYSAKIKISDTRRLTFEIHNSILFEISLKRFFVRFFRTFRWPFTEKAVHLQRYKSLIILGRFSRCSCLELSWISIGTVLCCMIGLLLFYSIDVNFVIGLWSTVLGLIHYYVRLSNYPQVLCSGIKIINFDKTFRLRILIGNWNTLSQIVPRSELAETISMSS